MHCLIQTWEVCTDLPTDLDVPNDFLPTIVGKTRTDFLKVGELHENAFKSDQARFEPCTL